MSFKGAVARACSNAADKIRTAHRLEQPFDRREGEEGELRDSEAEEPDPEEMDTTLYVREALAQLDIDRRRVIQLRMERFKVRSNDPQEPTISSLLGVSDRTVRTWLREAKATLREYDRKTTLESDRETA